MSDESQAPVGEPEPSDTGASRRAFLRGAGLAAAGAVGGGIAGAAIGAAVGAGAGHGEGERAAHSAAERELGLLPVPRKPGFDHLVVVMFENRSFDNIFGFLYDQQTIPAGTTFEGLDPDLHGNTDPIGGDTVFVHPYAGATDIVMSRPDPDPGEEYPHVNTQLFGTVDPAENALRHPLDARSPFNAPTDASRPTMDGFLADYVNKFRAEHGGAAPSADQYRQIMGAFTPQMLPVFSTLAASFAVYDDWHCAVPSQTFCNRSFFHASTSHGYVTNAGGPQRYGKWLDERNDAPTIFNRMEKAGLSWRVYFDDRQFISLTGFIHAPALQAYWKTNFFPMSQFYRDVADGALPDYAFVEPRMLYDHNDMHPPVGPDTATDVDGKVITGGAISDVRAGEALLHAVYDAVRTSANPHGSNAMNTMLLATFDEHGGTYDHVPPPAAVAPEERDGTEMDFGFDRLGVRVPAIAISAYTARGQVIHDTMHHGSVISTLTRKHGLKPLTDRDRDAPTIDNAVTLTQPRQPVTWPQTHPQYIPPNPESLDPVPDGDDDRPLSPPGVGLLGMLIAHVGGDQTQIPRTYREAFTLVEAKGRGLFGPGPDATGERSPAPTTSPARG